MVNCAWANAVSIKLTQSAILSVLCGYTDMLRSCDLLSKYFSKLTGEAKKRYEDKLKLIGCVQNPYYYLENPKAKVDNLLDWNNWTDVSYADIYNYLILTPSLYTHEQLKAYKSLDGYNFYTNGWVSDVRVTATQISRSRNFIATALIKHSQRLSGTPLKAWIVVKHTGEVIAAHCTCMAGVGEACSHVAALLFVLEGNTLLKQQFSCTSLPCSWLPASFRSVLFAEMSKIDFTTPSQKRKVTQINESSSSDKCTEEPKKMKLAISIPTDDDLQTFYKE